MRVRASILKLKPYEWEPSRRDIAEQMGIPEGEILRFDMNTVPVRPEKALKKFAEMVDRLPVNEYPDPSYRELKEALSEYVKVPPENIEITVGADEALDILAKTFVDPGTCALVASPTYSMYRISVELLDGRIIEVARRPDFSDNVEALIEQCKRPEARMVFLCSPNNPTGNLSKREDVVRLLETVECAVVVDEAYAEFAGESLVDLTGKYENLIIVRTFSKAFGMAGVRIGYMVAHPETIRLLSKARPPNSVSTISLTLAKLALENRDEILPKIEEIKRERERLAGRLAELPNVEVYPSQANFILARFEQADKVYSELLKRGMVLRRVSGPLLENCLRITVLDRKANDRLITSLKEVLGVKS